MGYATESLQAMVDLGRETGVQRLEAICHVDHQPSAKVLEKCGMTFIGDQIADGHPAKTYEIINPLIRK